MAQLSEYQKTIIWRYFLDSPYIDIYKKEIEILYPKETKPIATEYMKVTYLSPLNASVLISTSPPISPNLLKLILQSSNLLSILFHEPPNIEIGKETINLHIASSNLKLPLVVLSAEIKKRDQRTEEFLKELESPLRIQIIITPGFFKSLLLTSHNISTLEVIKKDIKEKRELIKVLGKLEEFVGLKVIFPPWDLDTLFSMLTDTQIQYVLKVLLSNNTLTEDMLATLIASLPKSGPRIKNNISKNLLKEVQSRQNSNFLQDPRWVEEVKFSVSTSIMKLFGEMQIENEKIQYLEKLKEEYENYITKMFLKRQNFEEFILKNIIEAKNLHTVISMIGRDTFLKAVVDVPEHILEKLSNQLSKRGVEMLIEDKRYKAKNIELGEIIRSKKEVIEAILALNFSEGYKRGEIEVEELIKTLKMNEEVYVIAQKVGISKFIIAVKALPTGPRKYILDIMTGPLKNLTLDIITGKVRFVSMYGEKTEKEAILDLLKNIWIIKNLFQQS